MNHRFLSMRRALVLAALVIGCATVLAEQARAQQMEDVVYLKDGSVIRGTIVEQQPGVSILIRTRDGNTFRYTMEQIDRLTKEARTGGGGASVQGKKSPGLAFLLSFLITGGGQGYNGQWGKAGIMFGGSVVGLTMLIVGLDSDSCYYDDSCAVAYAGLGLVVGMSLWSWIDAPISASAINRKIEAGGYGLELGPRLDVAAGPTLSPATRAALHAASVSTGPQLRLSLARVAF